MSKLLDQLRTVRIFNAHDFAGEKGNVFITYQTQETGRVFRCAGWHVARIGYQTDPNNANWSDYGDKVFNIFGRITAEARAELLAEAKTWAGKRYRITKWAKTPFGSWMDAGFVAKRMAELKSQLRVCAVD